MLSRPALFIFSHILRCCRRPVKHPSICPHSFPPQPHSLSHTRFPISSLKGDGRSIQAPSFTTDLGFVNRMQFKVPGGSFSKCDVVTATLAENNKHRNILCATSNSTHPLSALWRRKKILKYDVCPREQVQGKKIYCNLLQWEGRTQWVKSTIEHEIIISLRGQTY